MKTILLIHHCGAFGGAGVSLLHIVRSIDKTKYRIVVLCPVYPDEMINLLRKEECEVIGSKTSPKIFAHYNGGIANAFSPRTIKNGLDIIFDIKNIIRYMEETNPDIVAVNSMTLFWVGAIAKKLEKKTICFHRETYQKGLFGIRSKIIKYGLSNYFDKVAFISWNDFYETGNIKATKKVIYDRVDIPAYDNFDKQEARKILGFDQSKKYILYLGGMSALKGSEVIMDAMKYIKSDNTVLIFINNTNCIKKISGRQCKNLKEKLRYLFNMDIQKRTLNIYYRNRLQEKVKFVRKTSSPELYYKACDLAVFPSTKPHQARPVYEAGISKIPVLITDFKETNEFTQDGVTAITFKNRDSYDLAQKVELVLAGKINIHMIIKNNYQQAIRNHDRSTLSEDLNNLLTFE
mgnify:FL=1